MREATESIDIFQVLDVISKKKWFIIVFVLACVALTYVFTSLQERQYVLRSVLEIGKYQSFERAELKGLFLTGVFEYKFIENDDDTQSRYQAWGQNLANDKKYESLDIKPRKDIECEILSPALVQPELVVSKSKLAMEFMQELNNKVLEDHKRLMAPQKRNLRQQIKEMSQKLSDCKASLFDSSSKARSEDKSKMQESISRMSTSIDNKKNIMQICSRIIEPPVYGRLVQPRPIRNCILAIVVSFVLSLFIVFLYEMCKWYNMKER